MSYIEHHKIGVLITFLVREVKETFRLRKGYRIVINGLAKFIGIMYISV